MTHTFYYSGPLLYHTELNKKDLDNLKKLCLKNQKKDYRKNLAGHLNHEYTIDTEEFKNIIEKYLFEYYKAFEHWYDKKIYKFKTLVAWVNFMKAGDFNPPHIHTKCDFTCVLYLDVPKKLKDENEKYVGSIKNGGPGSISFIFSTNTSTSFEISSKNYFPKTGDFFIFPAHLTHFVTPFKSKIERISISANFNVETV